MSLFSTVADLFKPPPPLDASVYEALERVAEHVDPLLKLLPHFDRELALPLQHAMGYCEGLVAALPGPVDINRHAFANDPLVHALFATADDIDQMLGRSQAVRDFLAQPRAWDSDHFYAMFAARRQQRRQLGMAQQGDMIRNDVPQTVMFFSGQTLIEPGCDVDETLAGLRARALESLLHTFRAHLDVLRHERDDLRADLSAERAHQAELLRRSGNRDYETSTRHIDEIDASLREHAESLMPEHVLTALAKYLQAPEPALHLTPVSVTVDRMGVLQESAEQPGTATLNFPELTARDRRLHVAMLVRIDRSEAQEAVLRVRDQQHRFIIL